MRHRWFPILALVTLAIAAVPVHAQTPPARFFGAISLDGSPAPAGTEVVAYINDVECGRATTTDAGRYVLDVKSSATQSGCGEEGSSIRFTVNGANADQTGSFQLGHFIPLDLTAASGSATPPPAAPPSEGPPPSEEPPPAEPPAADPPPSDEPPPAEPPTE